MKPPPPTFCKDISLSDMSKKLSVVYGIKAAIGKRMRKWRKQRRDRERSSETGSCEDHMGILFRGRL